MFTGHDGEGVFCDISRSSFLWLDRFYGSIALADGMRWSRLALLVETVETDDLGSTRSDEDKVRFASLSKRLGPPFHSAAAATVYHILWRCYGEHSTVYSPYSLYGTSLFFSIILLLISPTDKYCVNSVCVSIWALI